jgi:hypothetical protein
MRPAADPVAQRTRRGGDPQRPADLFDDWLVAEVDASLALADWYSAPSGRKRVAHARYAVALELEAYAARRLELVLTGSAR